MKFTLLLVVPIVALIRWASGIIPGAIEEWREFSDAMKEERNKFRGDDK